MSASTDMRIEIVMGVEPQADDAVLVEAGHAAPPGHYSAGFGAAGPGPVVAGHALGCACCVPRGPVAGVLAAMFRARATGAAPFFKRLVVLATPAGEAAVRAAVAGDVLAGARFLIREADSRFR
ncbi:MAG: hypothetical protein POG74_12375 [Acidocella sp.]|nr:hypothetical protein [Acidocella sp.]